MSAQKKAREILHIIACITATEEAYMSRATQIIARALDEARAEALEECLWVVDCRFRSIAATEHVPNDRLAAAGKQACRDIETSIRAMKTSGGKG